MSHTDGRGRGRGGGLHEACDLGVYVRIVFDNSKDMDYSLVRLSDHHNKLGSPRNNAPPMLGPSRP